MTCQSKGLERWDHKPGNGICQPGEERHHSSQDGRCRGLLIHANSQPFSFRRHGFGNSSDGCVLERAKLCASDMGMGVWWSRIGRRELGCLIRRCRPTVVPWMGRNLSEMWLNIWPSQVIAVPLDVHVSQTFRSGERPELDKLKSTTRSESTRGSFLSMISALVGLQGSAVCSSGTEHESASPVRRFCWPGFLSATLSHASHPRPFPNSPAFPTKIAAVSQSAASTITPSATVVPHTLAPDMGRSSSGNEV